MVWFVASRGSGRGRLRWGVEGRQASNRKKSRRNSDGNGRAGLAKHELWLQSLEGSKGVGSHEAWLELLAGLWMLEAIDGQDRGSQDAGRRMNYVVSGFLAFCWDASRC